MRGLQKPDAISTHDRSLLENRHDRERKPMTGAGTEAVDAVLITASDAARLCGLGRSTWWRLHSSGQVPMPVKVGRATRWNLSELLAWIEAGCPSRARWKTVKAQS
ncbi:MAG TPA: helix-turn-helix domain-containing protein [Planctomycetes bacterium]|nr:helix-turn-helix domain-containing protein [Planctomycetota bacterium]